MGKLSAALFVTHAFVRQQVLAHDQALPPRDIRVIVSLALYRCCVGISIVFDLFL